MFGSSARKAGNPISAGSGCTEQIMNESRGSRDPVVSILEKNSDPDGPVRVSDDFARAARESEMIPESREWLKEYCSNRENSPEEIEKLFKIMTMPRLILEIGCGAGVAALRIALKNPDMGVIATDIYDWNAPLGDCSHYRLTAMDWKQRRLEAQTAAADNLVVLRAEADILEFFPGNFIDSILLINPEPRVGEAFLKLLRETSWIDRIKPGPAQIFVLPYARDMGLTACGGFEFDHSESLCKGLGFLMSSPFKFRKEESLHWGIDLSRISAYSKNSTQCGVYVYGNRFRHAPETFWEGLIKKIF